MEMGPYFLVRSHSSKHLRIYQVYQSEADSTTSDPIGVLWKVSAVDQNVPEEWRILCTRCPLRPRADGRGNTGRAFPDRDRALRWLLNHGYKSHPSLSPPPQFPQPLNPLKESRNG